MSDYNKIEVSFDETAAVRVRDGLRLKAVPMNPGKPDAWHGRCDGCPVTETEHGHGCNLAPGVSYEKFRTTFPRHCMRCDRKDGRNIVWRPA